MRCQDAKKPLNTQITHNVICIFFFVLPGGAMFEKEMLLLAFLNKATNLGRLK
jgi:hypothetical protein